MKALWRQRLRRHLQAQAKYLQLVFNDHFVLILVIMLGALLYGYAQLVKGMQTSWWLPLALAVIFGAVVQLGSVATIVEPADATFLLPQTSAFSQYLFKARRYSLILPLVVLSLATVAVLPMLKVLGMAVVPAGLTLVAGLWAFKDADLWLQVLNQYTLAMPRWVKRNNLLLVAFAALVAGFYWHPAVVLVAGLIVDLGLRLKLAAWLQPARLNWQRLVANEAKRMTRIYRFYNLFTDVPGLSGTVKRRKYLDVFARLVPRSHKRTWAWLLTRSFLRRTEFLGLYVRLVVIGAVVEAFVDQWWLAAALAALFVYLIGFQLLPMYQVHDEIVFSYLYPLPAAQKPAAFRGLVLRLLLIAAVVQSLGAVAAGHFIAAGAAFAAGVVVAALMAGWYLPLRVAKLATR
ncbi:ABC transporter permease [Lacticaseibacillus jixiensis]|uniref:ABC transporter permease n=1 Tax=Lacticaseibacillus jixiensis TaxID=3231926 RepID=UPI0036F2E1CC